ncbi:MAG: Iron-regulated ABC transporter membrane component SufB [Microgenomates group bacterium GW2011_GWA2_39_19]|nr:MAG: Iron-regulated ABC transporter membrane component SufB [Microgenomates group bacterium GW2011_GWA2_39_19]
MVLNWHKELKKMDTQTLTNEISSRKKKIMLKPEKGISSSLVEQISDYKSEPEWMRNYRLKSFEVFKEKKMPAWGPDLSGVNFDDIYYYSQSSIGEADSWEEVPKQIKDTYVKLGIPEAEQKYLAGVKAQWDSEVVYGSVLKTLKKKGVVFMSMDEGLEKYPDLVRRFIGSVVPPEDNKFAALNSAVWSGGSFLYVPKGVKVDMPLQAYFRINARRMGQFERTLIVADEGSFVHYLEGCTSPIYTSNSLHAGVVEIIVKKGARVRYTTVQNWSKNVYNLVTKRAKVEEEGIVEWVDFNGGSKVTMKYPSVYLVGKKARGDVLSLSMAGAGQYQDTGGKVLHLASETSSRIISKSISYKGGRTSYRGLVRVAKNAKDCKVKVNCDALILDKKSRSDTYPVMSILGKGAFVEHEASVSKIEEEKLFYLESRGLGKSDSEMMIVNGFIEPITREIPFEYAIELNRLVKLEMEGSMG